MVSGQVEKSKSLIFLGVKKLRDKERLKLKKFAKDCLSDSD